MNKLTIIAAALLLNGCAGSPLSMLSKTSDELKSEETLNMCVAYSLGSDKSKARIKAELARRDYPVSWGNVRDRTVQMGISDCTVAATFGLPHYVRRTSWDNVWAYERWNGVSFITISKQGRVVAWSF